MVALLGKFIPQDWGDSNLHIYIYIYIFIYMDICMSIYLPWLYRGCRAHTLRPLFTWWATILPTYAFYVVICVIMCECLFVCACVYIYIYEYIWIEREGEMQTSWSQVLIDPSYLAKLCWFPSEKMINRTEKKHTSLSLYYLLCRNGLQIPVAILPKLVLPK